MIKRDILITDIDNTIYDFISFFGKSFRSMIHAISKKYKINEEDLYMGFRDVYKKYGYIEYQEVINEIKILRDMFDDVEKIIITGRSAFDKTRRKNIKLYSGMLETLIELNRRGVYIIGLTNAPLYLSMRRLRNELKVLKYFSAMLGYEGRELEKSTIIRKKYQREFENAKKSYLDFIMLLEKSELKPSAAGYKKILNNINFDINNIYALGDSAYKDLMPAKKIGAKTIYAEYGTKFSRDDLKTILKITPWTGDDVKIHKEVIKDVIDYTAERPTDILKIIEGTQPSLF